MQSTNLDNVIDAVRDIDTEEIAAFLRGVRQGQGLTPRALAGWLTTTGIELSDDQAARLACEFETATSLVVHKGWRRAIRNALGLESSGSNLTDRRTSYLTNERISLSTLIRHEDAGAVKTAEALRAMQRGELRPEGANLDQIMELLVVLNTRFGRILDQIGAGVLVRLPLSE